MNSNWALRSEGETVGSCLRLTRREKPAAVSRPGDGAGGEEKPRRRGRGRAWRWCGESSAGRSKGLRRCRVRAGRRGQRSVQGFFSRAWRPPPGRRTCPRGSRTAWPSSSRRPRATVEECRPVRTAAPAVEQPCPAFQSRRVRRRGDAGAGRAGRGSAAREQCRDRHGAGSSGGGGSVGSETRLRGAAGVRRTVGFGSAVEFSGRRP